MWIVTTTAFIDKQAEDPEQADVPAGKKMNVSAERGNELIDMGLAEEAAAPSAKPAKARVKPARKAKAPAPIAPLPEPAPATPAETEIHPIAPGNAEPIDGHLAADITHD